MITFDDFFNLRYNQKPTLKKLYKQVFGMEFCIDEIENLSGEEWKPIENTENKYFIAFNIKHLTAF